MYCWKDIQKSFEVLQEQDNFFKLMFLPWLVQCIFRGSISAVNGFCHDRPQRRAASLRALNCLTNLRYASFTARSGFFLAFFCYFHIIAHIFCLSVKALQKYTLFFWKHLSQGVIAQVFDKMKNRMKPKSEISLNASVQYEVFKLPQCRMLKCIFHKSKNTRCVRGKNVCQNC